ncbi:hypothetical protein J4P02_07580 [Pseudomonas sp. NFXW11]|uniref:hypothetical protein n=1 Tax=Pseudomonas sp. NFXW11 TaxID=2819531 RepID=UPI003CEEFF0D
MQSAVQQRDAFIKTIKHIRTVVQKVVANSGPKNILRAPDSHKIAEGLFLSAATHWEELCQGLLLVDLATDNDSLLFKHVKGFRTKNGSHHLAELLVSHLDHPHSFYDWSDFNKLHTRANKLFPKGHRFAPPAGAPTSQKTCLPAALLEDLIKFKRLRNAVAHKSDKAWETFMKMIKESPFSLTSSQRKGITPGRFMVTKQWDGQIVLLTALDKLETAAKSLVP